MEDAGAIMKVFGNCVCVAVALALAGCDAGQPSRQNSPLPNGGPAGEEPAAASKDTGPRFEPLPDGPDAEKEFTTTKSGLKYRILRKGNGKFANINSRFVAHYRGWLDNGTEFDSSYKKGAALGSGPEGPWPLTRVVPGWTEALQIVDEGGKIELEIPPELGYRDEDKGTIPPNSTLHFIMELEEVVP
jgi:FKBP-type peptidyl-prolyl cis-trans isomerase FkpA